MFDSGVGGLSILRELRRELPKEEFVYFSDGGHAPYGERADAFVAERSRAITRRLLDEHRIKALVVACNTATAAALHLLRAEHGQLPFVGVEPALKPAASATRTGRIAVFATRGTLASARFRALHDAVRGPAEFVLQPCDGLAAAIENDREAEIRDLCGRYARLAGEFGSAPGRIDTVVLGCTHYPFAMRVLQDVLGPDVRIVETGEPVARQARRLLDVHGISNGEGAARVTFLTSGPERNLREAAQRWLGL
ncbi:MAG: glutamate racemase [Ramlibacter sp.]